MGQPLFSSKRQFINVPEVNINFKMFLIEYSCLANTCDKMCKFEVNIFKVRFSSDFSLPLISYEMITSSEGHMPSKQ